MKIDAKKDGLSATPMLSYKVDWLAFTISSSLVNNRYEIKKILNPLGYDLDLFEEVPGRYFYNSGLTIGNYFSIYFNDLAKEYGSKDY